MAGFLGDIFLGILGGLGRPWPFGKVLAAAGSGSSHGGVAGAGTAGVPAVSAVAGDEAAAWVFGVFLVFAAFHLALRGGAGLWQVRCSS